MSNEQQTTHADHAEAKTIGIPAELNIKALAFEVAQQLWKQNHLFITSSSARYTFAHDIIARYEAVRSVLQLQALLARGATDNRIALRLRTIAKGMEGEAAGTIADAADLLDRQATQINDLILMQQAQRERIGAQEDAIDRHVDNGQAFEAIAQQADAAQGDIVALQSLLAGDLNVISSMVQRIEDLENGLLVARHWMKGRHKWACNHTRTGGDCDCGLVQAQAQVDNLLPELNAKPTEAEIVTPIGDGTQPTPDHNEKGNEDGR